MNKTGKQPEPWPLSHRLPLVLLLCLGLLLWLTALPWGNPRPGLASGFTSNPSGYSPLDFQSLTGQVEPSRLAIFTFAPISLNQADLQTLTFLPGIGPTLAGRIIEHRQLHGPFLNSEQLLAVPGIGPKTLARLRPLVSP
ncbi:ComEA family DNA-binding protein [Desulfurivibrio sp. D14AmB]|uniref:ComEA family DNA-binding protein n=1 Tax=Desulfurivibrio sp. D14AmB TaxID=3374370 RepID=UPI00376EB94D